MKLEKGITAIIPTYKGEKYIDTLLNSIKNQTIDFSLLEIIFIVNGELDKTPEIIENFMKENPQIDINLQYSEKGVCNARNHGIELIKKEYATFIDDDDYISDKFFEVLLKHAKEDRIVVGTFLNINVDGSTDYLSPETLNNPGILEYPYRNEFQQVLTITTDKLIPTKYIKETLFDPVLNNGVDMGYFSEFYAKNDLEVYVVDKEEECTYCRVRRDGSISRQNTSYSFNITDRLKVINKINQSLKIANSPEKTSFIKSLTGGQVVYINKYLNEHPEDYIKVLKDISSYNFDFFPYKYLNETKYLDQENNELFISFCFPPTNTTQGNVTAKRILIEKNNVDIISATNPSLSKDYRFEKIVDQFIIRNFKIDMDFSREWSSIKEFVEKGMKEIENLTYDKIYSRAYDPHNHFLALEYKLKYPDTYWRAEFSDPMRFLFNDKELSSPIDDEDYVNKINKVIPNEYKPIKTSDSVYKLCEILAYIFADEIIFTNENQYSAMMDYLDEPIDIENKVKINSHGTLDEKYYYIEDNDYEIDKNYVNFAYFGSIFGNRSLEDFIEGFDNLNPEYKELFRLHIFSPTKIMCEQVLSDNVRGKTKINPNVDFFNFLNLCTKFDVLLVEDSQIESIHKKNPFLPSKISDYLGSDASIWAVCDEGSPMDKMDLKYKSRLNNLISTKETINRIMEDKLNLKSENKDDKLKNLLTSDDENIQLLVKELAENNIYFKQRLRELSTRIDELVHVAEDEFRKDRLYEEKIAQLEDENNKMKNSNSWKYTEKLRKIGRKLK